MMIDIEMLKARAAARLQRESMNANTANPANRLMPSLPISQLATLAALESARRECSTQQKPTQRLTSQSMPADTQADTVSPDRRSACAGVANPANRLIASSRGRLSESACRVASMLGALAFLGDVDARNLAVALQWRGPGEVPAALEELRAAGLVTRRGTGFRLREGRPC